MKELIKKFIPSFLINWYHFSLAFLGAFFYKFPSKNLIVIGITGTNGKSTVVDLTTQILETKGYKVASLSSVRFKIKDKEWKNTLKMTMPGRGRVQKFLREAVNAGCKYAVIEVTSEGIKQHRHRFIDFNVAVFTNLTPEHIETHGSFKKYKEAKGKLFKDIKISIVNLDDENADFFLDFPAHYKFGFGIISGFKPQVSSFIKATDINLFSDGATFKIKDTQFDIKLVGVFNIYNVLAAVCVALSQDIDLETCIIALEKIKGIPGRMEKVISQPFEVIVDYAHTPDSLKKVYEAVRNSKSQTKNPKLICVLGSAGGGRDKWKRPELGKIAEKYCDQIILTNEDPYDEDPFSILGDIEKGFSQISNYEKILDRREAIKKALSLAKNGDTVIITGKGCEIWMCVEKGKKIPWDDRKIVQEEFSKLRG